MREKVEIGSEILYLTYKDIAAIGLNEEEVFKLVEDALREHGRRNCEMPAKIGLHPVEHSLMHSMPAFMQKSKACGIKWASAFPENFKFCLPQVSGLLILNDWRTGFPLAIMDAIWITAKRTAAVTAVASKYLARKDSKQLGIIGAGVQGREHVKALSGVLSELECLKVYDLKGEVLKDFLEEFRADSEFEILAAKNYRDAVEDSDVVVSATAILWKPNPMIRDEWIKRSGVFIAPVDFDSLWEFDTMKRMDKFLVDSVEEMKYFEGIGYLPQGLPKVHAELGEIVCGSKVGRESDQENIMDMNIGMAVEDVTMANELYRLALEKGIGRKLPL